MTLRRIEFWQPQTPLSAPGYRPGYWLCELATQRLRWSGEVFDLFGLSPERALDRRATVEMYCDHSREEMEWLRAEAIARRAGFSLDAEIQRPDGTRRWMRLTARVHCRNGRPTHIFGTKRDITPGADPATPVAEK